jgi:hypothetical protein
MSFRNRASKRRQRREAMHIVCLGWGSLVWKPGDLPVRGIWFDDGPFLPIEFARQSSDGRITLVLVPDTFPLVRSMWKPMSVLSLNEARAALGARECWQSSEPENCVDYWPRGSTNRAVARKVGQWAKRSQIDAVVWTNLPPKFDGENQRIPTPEEVVDYLRGLDGEERQRAEEYIRKAPRQIDTNYRRAIEKELGWKPIN